MRKLTLHDIINLPPSDPNYIQFMKEVNDLDDAYADVDMGSVYDDEESLEYFDCFIAGDL